VFGTVEARAKRRNDNTRGDARAKLLGNNSAGIDERVNYERTAVINAQREPAGDVSSHDALMLAIRASRPSLRAGA